MGTGQSKISARIKNVWGDVWGRKLKIYLLLTPDIQRIVRNGCFSHPSFIVFLWVPCVCGYLAVMPAVNTTGIVLSGTATTSTCHFSCTVPVYLAGSVQALGLFYVSYSKPGRQRMIVMVFSGTCWGGICCAQHCCLHQQEPSRAAVRMLSFLFLEIPFI